MAGQEGGNGQVPLALPYGEVLYDAQQVTEGIRWLAACTVEQYHDGPKPLFIALQQGGTPFASRLMTEIVTIDPWFHPELDSMTIGAYKGTRLDGKPRLRRDIHKETKVSGRHIVLLDEIIETGSTTMFAVEHLRKKGAARIDMAALTIKQCARDPSFEDLPGEYVACFEVPDRWVTGMGMDHDALGHEANRWLPFIAIASGA